VSFERRFDLVERREKTKQPLDREVQRAADAELRADAACFARFGERAVESCEDVASFIGEDAAGFGLRDDTARAPEQGNAELVLQLADRLGERRLRDMEPLRGSAEVELLADCEEVTQVPQLDRRLRRSLPRPPARSGFIALL